MRKLASVSKTHIFLLAPTLKILARYSRISPSCLTMRMQNSFTIHGKKIMNSMKVDRESVAITGDDSLATPRNHSMPRSVPGAHRGRGIAIASPRTAADRPCLAKFFYSRRESIALRTSSWFRTRNVIRSMAVATSTGAMGQNATVASLHSNQQGIIGQWRPFTCGAGSRGLLIIFHEVIMKPIHHVPVNTITIIP